MPMDEQNKSIQGPRQPSVHIVVFVVHTYIEEFRYSIPLDEKDTIADLTNKIHRISRLDDENFFGLYPQALLDAFRENWRRNHGFGRLGSASFARQRIPETEDAMKYAHQTLVLLYISK